MSTGLTAASHHLEGQSGKAGASSTRARRSVLPRARRLAPRLLAPSMRPGNRRRTGRARSTCSKSRLHQAWDWTTARSGSHGCTVVFPTRSLGRGESIVSANQTDVAWPTAAPRPSAGRVLLGALKLLVAERAGPEWRTLERRGRQAVAIRWWGGGLLAAAPG
jgi:hypothetical protein